MARTRITKAAPSRVALWLFVVVFLACIVFAWFDQLDISTCLDENVFVTGMVEDCCCPVDTVDNQIDEIYDSLAQVCKRTFFKYFKVNYERDCPFWVAEYLCSMTDGGGCGVCACDDNEIPAAWRESDKPIDPTLNPQLTKWQDDECDMWTHKNFNEGSYLNLELNAQRHTGFVGYEANRIWKMIYNENCFHVHDDPDHTSGPSCFEERVFFRLLSGFHASVSLAIAENYRDPITGTVAPSTEEFNRRFGGHPEWLKNVYFTFLFLLRAATHARPFLSEYDYATGVAEDDALTREQMRKFLEIPLCNGCIPTFNESEMFTSPDANELKQQLRAKFRNISEIMDCVACESCKVQAKLNVLGIGTALKILVADADKRPTVIQNLQRNEIIALINALRKYSGAIITIRKMEQRIAAESQQSKTLFGKFSKALSAFTNSYSNGGNHLNSRTGVYVVVAVMVLIAGLAGFFTARRLRRGGQRSDSSSKSRTPSSMKKKKLHKVE